MTVSPFSAKMNAEEFMLIGQSLRDKGHTLAESYEIAETIHQAFYNQTRYKDFESFKDAYYRTHPQKR